MGKIRKTYSSYEEINLDLEILKTERSIAYHKIKRNLSDTKSELKNSFTPLNFIKSNLGIFSSANSKTNIKAIILSALINFIIRKIKKRKE